MSRLDEPRGEERGRPVIGFDAGMSRGARRPPATMIMWRQDVWPEDDGGPQVLDTVLQDALPATPSDRRRALLAFDKTQPALSLSLARAVARQAVRDRAPRTGRRGWLMVIVLVLAAAVVSVPSPAVSPPPLAVPANVPVPLPFRQPDVRAAAVAAGIPSPVATAATSLPVAVPRRHRRPRPTLVWSDRTGALVER
jgi:hypothetical protein